ncbi:hypothetical protein TRIHO_16250 [Tritonibacter horizontis]|uniref:Hedgehog/Intein (Hint) domain-containing protein n=2 Tax=Tritonibacter horizontis TaxID=1768241 RepID=A0A132C070_9RHOB|nr:hypothetical protein TRIHO_16250 [Tritonibacter horizontis]
MDKGGGASHKSGCDDTGVPCFTPGIRIATQKGAVRVEDLRPGDLLQTADNGYQPVVWVGRRDLSGAELARLPDLRPVKIRPGSPLGNDRPLLVSPQHRLFVRKSLLGDLASQHERFLRARLLCQLSPNLARIQSPEQGVSYLHVLTPRHEVIFADGIATETLWPGPMALRGLSPKDRAELFTLFPELRSVLAARTRDDRDEVHRAYGGLARPDLSGSDLRALSF